jgi:phage shock protein E
MEEILRRLIYLMLIVISLLAAACQGSVVNDDSSLEAGRSVSAPGGSYRDISAAGLQAMLEDKDFVLINVHIPYEGDLPETDLSIPYNQVEDQLNQLPADRDAKIVLYCRSDRMSTEAARTLVGLGYTNIWNLTGGMVAWERAGLPLIQK